MKTSDAEERYAAAVAVSERALAAYSAALADTDRLVPTPAADAAYAVYRASLKARTDARLAVVASRTKP